MSAATRQQTFKKRAQRASPKGLALCRAQQMSRRNICVSRTLNELVHYAEASKCLLPPGNKPPCSTPCAIIIYMYTHATFVLHHKTNISIFILQFLFCSTEYFFYFCMLKKAVIVTRDEETTINEGGLSIEIVPVWKWLLSQ